MNLRRLTFYILLFLFCGTNIYSQSPIKMLWQHRYGGNGSEFGNAVVKTNDGGYATVSATTSTDTFLLDCAGGASRNLLVKTDSLGNFEWGRCLGNISSREVNDLKQTSDGGYITIGSTYSSQNVHLVKTDNLGNTEWEQSYPGGDDVGTSIKQLSDGSYIFTGYAEGGTGNHGLLDYWLVKTDTVGNIIWEKCYGGSQDEIPWEVNVASDGGYFVCGTSRSYNGDVTNAFGNGDLWVIKTDTVGNLEWQKIIGGSGLDEGSGILATPDGGCVISGTTNSADGNITGNHGNLDFWLSKLDSTGTIVWGNCISEEYAERSSSLEFTPDGGYIVAGYITEAPYFQPSPSIYNFHGADDMFVVKTDSIGNPEWKHCFGGSEIDHATGVVCTTDNNYLVVGYTVSEDGDIDPNSNTDRDCWVVKFSDHANEITGNSFGDLNFNNIIDSTDFAIPFQKITESTTETFDFTGSDGNFQILVIDSGSYSISPEPLNYFSGMPLNYNIIFTGMDEIDSLNNFVFQPTGTVNDLCINISPLGNFRSGFNANYMITYNNLGNTAIIPTIIFLKDPNLTYLSSVPTADIITADSLVWTPGVLQPFQSASIVVSVHVNVGLPIGTLINSGARIEPIAGDANPFCNSSYWEVYTTGSMDPNDITVSRTKMFNTEFPNPPFLEYIIRFQNTGNDTAFTVKVDNNLPGFLKLETIQIEAASHPMSFEYQSQSRLMTFHFDNILLPDKFVNEPLSHGFIRYRVQPVDSLVTGNQIKNKASIYFDYNSPVVTNNAITTVVLPVSLQEINSIATPLMIYPNPGKNIIDVEFKNIGVFSTICLSDITGRIVLFKEVVDEVVKNKITINT